MVLIYIRFLLLSLMFKLSYSAKFVKEYIEAAKPIFSIGEYWDSCNYNGNDLDHNQGKTMHFVLCMYYVINWNHVICNIPNC